MANNTLIHMLVTKKTIGHNPNNQLARFFCFGYMDILFVIGIGDVLL